jgi:ribosomal protein S18 acetylase RimI-like enzyme
MQRRDLAAVLALTHTVPEAPWWSEAHVEEIVAAEPDSEMGARFRRGWVANPGQQTTSQSILGFIVLHALRLPGSLAEIECEIESIVVHPDFRGRGVGKQLLETALAWCRKNQASILSLEVRSRNVSAIRLYLRSGFVATGTRPAYYEAPQDDALQMELRLKEAPWVVAKSEY